MTREIKERALFNRMLNHHMKSFSKDSTTETREYHFKLYEITKRELWKFQELDND